MNKNKIDTIGLIIGLIGFIVFFLYLFLFRYPKVKKEITENGCYTYALTYGLKWIPYNGFNIKYKYKYKGKTYYNLVSKQDYIKKEGDVYLIRISKKHPDWVELILMREK